MSSLTNVAFVEYNSNVMRWVDSTGVVTRTTTISGAPYSFIWDKLGNYFYVVYSQYIEKWARDGTTYEWRRTINYSGHNRIALNDDNDQLLVGRQDDIYVLDVSDGSTDYSNLGDFVYRWTIGSVCWDSSDNIYVQASDLYNYTDGAWIFKFDSTLSTELSSFQISTGGYIATELYVDSSGNIFAIIQGYLKKYNSSGVEQWTYACTNDVVFENNKIYCCSNYLVSRLTDNGSSVSEDWSWDSLGEDVTYTANRIAVDDERVFVFSTTGNYNNSALLETDGSFDEDFFHYDPSGVIYAANKDPLWSATSGPLETTTEILYSRWVLTGGIIDDCGPLEIEEQVSIRGFGDELIDKLYVKGNWNSGSPRYEHVVTVGSPPAEDFSFTPYEYQQYTYNIQVDNDFNMYVICRRYYTAVEAEERSDGYYTDGDYYWSVKKYSPSGVELWETPIVIGIAIYNILLTPDQQYILTLTTIKNITDHGFIERYSTFDGTFSPNDYYPLDTLSYLDGPRYESFRFGRDGCLYCVIDDASEGYDTLYKWNEDGSVATGWSTPIQIIGENAYDQWVVKDLDANANGYVCVAGTSNIGDDTPIKIYDSDQTLYKEYRLPNSEYGSSFCLMDDSQNVICGGYDNYGPVGAGYYTFFIPPSGTNQFDYTITWQIYPAPSIAMMWNATGDFDYYYSRDNKYDASDGEKVYELELGVDTLWSWAGVAPLQVAAWKITVTYGSNGIVKTNSGVSPGGVILTSGEVALAESGKDYTLQFVGDTGYYVEYITVDSVNLGYRSQYTFENVSTSHSIHVVFGEGFPSGPFTITYEMFGGILNSISAGSFSETYALEEPVLKWVISSGPHIHAYEITGEGYLPFDIALFYLINAHRSSNAVASVVEDPREWLIDGAEYAVADMVANGSLTKTLEQVMGQDGANWPYLYAGAIPSVLDESFTPQDLFDAWIANGPTEAVILSSNYENLAIYVESYDGDNYVFALFATWHPQYIVERMTENFDAPLSLETTYFFDYLSAAKYAELIANIDNVKLPEYAANIGDYEIPKLLSFNYRMELDVPSQLTMTCIFSNEVMDEIEARQDDSIFIESIFYSLGTETRTAVLNVSFTEFSMIAGETPKLSISGYEELRYYESTAELRNVMTRIKDEQGKTRFRCSQPDFYLRPGCIATWGEYSITIEKIVIFVNNGVTQYMEITGV
jgi:hypothetical protein